MKFKYLSILLLSAISALSCQAIASNPAHEAVLQKALKQQAEYEEEQRQRQYQQQGLNPQGEPRWTHERALESHLKNTGQIDLEIQHRESIDRWNSFDRTRRNTDSSNGGQLEHVWKGNAAEVRNSWGPGLYFVKVFFGHDNAEGTAVVNVDGSSRTQRVGIPSPYNYQGNYHVDYKDGKFATYQYRTSGKPMIVSIHKQNVEMKRDCAEGTTKSRDLNCGLGFTCEAGIELSKCVSGSWSHWYETKRPVCAVNASRCR